MTHSQGRSSWSAIILFLYVMLSVNSFKTATNSVHRREGQSAFTLACKTGSLAVDSQFLSPDSVSAMMKDVAEAIIAARDARVSLALVDVPVPVTGMYS